MILGRDIKRLIKKLNFGDGGGIGGTPGDPTGGFGAANAGGGTTPGGNVGGGSTPGSGQGQSDASIAADPDTGNFSGMATGFGQDGYGTPDQGQPGIFGGGILGGMPPGTQTSQGAIASSDADFAGISAEADASLGIPSGFSVGNTSSEALAMFTDLSNRGKLHADSKLTNSLFSSMNKSDRAEAISMSNMPEQSFSLFGQDFSISPVFAGLNFATFPGFGQAAQAIGNALSMMSGVLIGEPEGMVPGGPNGDIYEQVAYENNVSVEDVVEVHKKMVEENLMPPPPGILNLPIIKNDVNKLLKARYSL